MLRLHRYRSTNSGHALAISEEIGGCELAIGPEEFAFITIVLFFVSMMFVLQK